jgi:hypothetical protein
MRALALTVLLLAQAPQQPEVYPGQANHAEPPAGWNCQRAPMERLGKAGPEEQAKWCSCERGCDPSMLGPDNEPIVHADKQCSTWCWEKQHCDCDVSGMDMQTRRCMPEQPPR